MADSDDVTSARDNLKQGEIKFGASISEATMTKIAGGINFVNTRQAQVHVFNFHGPFKALNGGEDGSLIVPTNFSLHSVTGFIRVSGSLSSTIIDIHRVTSAGDQGSIFSTPLTIPSSVSAVPFGKNFQDNTEQASGTTLPVASVTDFNAFDMLRVDIQSNAVGALDLTLNIWYRPR